MKTIVSAVVSPDQVDSILHQPANPTDYDCLEAVVDRFSEKCFRIGKVSMCYVCVCVCVYVCVCVCVCV